MNGSLTFKLVQVHKPIIFLKPFSSGVLTANHVSEQGLQIFRLTSLQCGTLLQSLTNTRSYANGRQLHAHMVISGTLFENTYLSTKLAAWYANCGHLAEAQAIFDQILFKNLFLWNFMIRGYATNGRPLKSLQLFREMLLSGWKPDNFTFPFVIKACSDLLAVGVGRKVHGMLVVSGFDSDTYVCNSLISMYSKFGDVIKAGAVFVKMIVKDLTSWNSMISGYVKNGEARVALFVYEEMRRFGVVPDGTTLLAVLSACGDLMDAQQGKAIHGYVIRNCDKLCNEYLMNSLIDMYCKCNLVDDGRRLFEELKVRDVVSWNSLITGYERNGNAFESLNLFSRMLRQDVHPDEVSVSFVLGACTLISGLQLGSSLHSLLVKKGFSMNIVVKTSLVDMYCKCGNLNCSRRAFDEMGEKSLLSWTTMIAGYGIHGRGRDAISIFSEMLARDIVPDEGVIASVVSACSHSGLVNEGKEIFYKIIKQHNVAPGPLLYSCLVDLIARAGNLDEAYELIRSMKFKPSYDLWAALLSACRLHRNVKLAEIATQHILETSPEQVSSYVCLSNIYAVEQRWRDVESMRALVQKKQLRKPTSCSFVEVDKMVHQFFVGDMSHPQTDEIYAKLRELRELINAAGYKADTSSILHDVEEEAKEMMLWDHSERLALAYSLINTGPEFTIRITKNLRVCADCHAVTKLISKLLSREIIMRDIRRFHHFREGMCTCGDYW